MKLHRMGRVGVQETNPEGLMMADFTEVMEMERTKMEQRMRRGALEQECCEDFRVELRQVLGGHEILQAGQVQLRGPGR